MLIRSYFYGSRMIVAAMILLSVVIEAAGATPISAVPQTAIEAQWKMLPRIPDQHCLAENEAHGAVVMNDKLFLIGGLSKDGNVTRKVSVYNLETGKWSSAPPLPLALSHINAAVVGDRIYVVGGLHEEPEQSKFKGSGRVFVLFDGADDWIERKSMPRGTERGASGVGVLKNRYVIVAGGHRRENGSIVEVSTVSLYDVEEDYWIARRDLPAALGHVAGAVIDGMFFAFGGRSPNQLMAGTVSNAVWAYDLDRDMWTPRAPMPTTRTSHGAVSVEERLIVVAGGLEFSDASLRSRYSPITDVFEPKGDRWIRGADLPTPRLGFAIAASGNRVYAAGGIGGACTLEMLEIAPRS